MKKFKKLNKTWKSDVEPHDYDAASDFLDLLFHKQKVGHYISELKNQIEL